AVCLTWSNKMDCLLIGNRLTAFPSVHDRRAACSFMHFSSFILYPSSFILYPSSFILEWFIPHPLT
ncbi:MAG: hypothetical protein ACREV2_13730, partial [Burkholderiales bacterium]